MSKSLIRINISYIFDSLLIMVSKLVVKSVSLRFGSSYIHVKRILFLRIVISVVRMSRSAGFPFLWPGLAIDQ